MATTAFDIEAGQSKAPTTNVTCHVSQILGNNPACKTTIRGKIFSGLSFSGYTPGDLDSITHSQISPTSFQPSYTPNPTISSGGSSTPTGGIFNYTVTADPAFQSLGFSMIGAQAFIAGGTFGGGSATKTLASPAITNPGNSKVSVTNGTSSNGMFNPNVVTATFAQAFSTVDGTMSNPGTITNFGSIIVQNQAFTPPGNSVPGPLPILGAGAAFGFSRKLRRLVKQAA